MEILNNIETADAVKNGFLISLMEESEEIDLNLQPIIVIIQFWVKENSHKKLLTKKFYCVIF